MACPPEIHQMARGDLRKVRSDGGRLPHLRSFTIRRSEAISPPCVDILDGR